MDNFLILLQAKLDEAKSKGNINSDIDKLQNQIDKLKIQAEIDQNSVKNIAQQLSKIMNQKVVVDNIQIDTKQTAKAGEQLGQNLGNSLNRNLISSLNSVKQNIDNVIKGFSNQKLNSYDLSKMFNLNRANNSSVVQQVRSLTNELNSLAKEAMKTNSDSSWEGIVNKLNSLSKVLTRFGTGRDLAPFKESLEVLDYFQNKKIFVGDKSEALANAGMSVKELNNQFRNLGITFTTVSEGSTKLDTIWTELFNISPGLEKFTTFGDQISAVVDHLKIAKEAMYGDSNLQPLGGKEVNKVLLDWLSNLENASKKLTVFRDEQVELEQRIAQSSTSATNIIVQNEQKKQKSFQQTANIQKQISESESIIKSGKNVLTFEHTNNAAREASEYFQQLLQDENAIISVSERFNNINGLTSFTVNVKRATGEVESLRYSLEEIRDANGNGTGDFLFTNKGGELNNANAIKQIQAIENAFADYTAKLAQFKSTNSEILSGLSTPISDFESKLAGLKNGTSTISEVVNSFKSLNTEASNITANFSRQLSPIDSAIRNLAKGEETIASFRAEIKGLNNAPKEINTELNKCSSLLAKVKQIESENGRTSEWSQAYKEWANAVDALKAKLTTLRKEQSNVASTQIFKIGDLKNNDIAYMSKVYNTIEKQMSEINKMANAKGWNIVDVSGVEQADGKIKQLTLTVQDAEGALKRLTMQREKLQGNGKAQFGLMQVGDVKVIETAAQAQEKLAQSAAKANAKLSEQANKIQLSMDNGTYESKVESLIAKTQQWTDVNGNARISTTTLSTALNDLTTASEAYANNPSEVTQKRLIESSKNLDAEYKKITNSVRSMNATMAKDSSILSLQNKVADFMSKNGKAVKWSGEFKKIFNELSQGAGLTRQRVAELTQEFNNTVVQARNAGKLGKTFFQTLREGMSSFSYWTSSTFLVMKAIQSVKSGIGTVKALDTALVDLKKTTTMTNSELEDFYYSSNKVAKQMGVTTAEIINQAAAWSRLGFSSEAMATKMAKYSSMFASISPGLDLDSATNGLVSTMKAFSIGLDNADDVVDGIMSKINIIGNSKALNNSDIVDFLTRSSSALASANNSIEESIAMGEAIVEITRDAAGAGQVMKTTSMRIRGYDEDLESYTEDLENLKGEIADLTKTAKTPGGISLFTDETKETYKSTYKILEEISEIWNDLTDKNQANNMCLYVQKCA